MNSIPCLFLHCFIHFCRRTTGNPATKLLLSTWIKGFSAFSHAQLTNEGFLLAPASTGSLLPNASSVIFHALSTPRLQAIVGRAQLSAQHWWTVTPPETHPSAARACRSWQTWKRSLVSRVNHSLFSLLCFLTWPSVGAAPLIQLIRNYNRATDVSSCLPRASIR